MKKLLVIAVIALTAPLAQAQGLQKTFDPSCDCYEITNYYDGGQLSAKLHENKQGQRHGLEIIYYQNGEMQYERIWKNGKLDGEAKHYYRTGKLHYTEYHNNGVKVGEWKFYDEEGDLVQSVAYTGENNDGTYKYYHAGVLYLEQTLINGALSAETVHNETIYNALKEEYEQNLKAKMNAY